MLLLTKYTVLYKENEICCIILLSLPSRERGLKYMTPQLKFLPSFVAPFAGAWIEMLYQFDLQLLQHMSLPSRERGLKSCKSGSFPFSERRSLRGSVD